MRIFSNPSACFALFLAAIAVFFPGCASRAAASAEEYYSIGMAYFQLAEAESDAGRKSEKYREAEKWLNRARAADKTRTASEYNLGRIAFETGRFDEASDYFERILKTDPDNIMALKAAAYCKIKTRDFEQAESFYTRVLALTPESMDDGYNYALVCYAMEKYEKTEEILSKYPFALSENNDALLLYARSLSKLDRIEAVDSYAQLIANGNTDSRVRYEYALLLERGEFFAKALEEYRVLVNAIPADQVEPSKAFIRFTIARLLLTADSENTEGIGALNTAVSEGFADMDALEALLEDERIVSSNKEEIRKIIGNIQNKDEEEKTEP
ncbi:MAG: tetratricopeptide repeat protein [Treponema sp.]|jgi:tetratricopeptide (TPR) repeat protein|nr:tetratricopeptide repeat protein [Treponema sp.]